jgi:hypothetical protein
MPFIPRHVKAPPPFVLTCRLPQAVATSLQQYVEFLESPREYVVTEILRLAFRRDKEFHAWLVATYPEAPLPGTTSPAASGNPLGRTQASPAAKTTPATARRVPTLTEPHPQQADRKPLAPEDRRTP